MLGRKYWAESLLSEHSAQKTWGETSNSFRMGVFGFLWRALFPSSLFCFFAVWLWLLRFFWGFLFLALIFFFRILRITHLYFVTANGKLFSSSFEMLGTHIDLGLGIRPLECCGDELHQVVHEHASTFLRIEDGVREPGIHASSPLLQIQG